VNWNFIGEVAGEDSRDPLAGRFPGKKTSRQFYWTTDSYGESIPFELDPFDTRVAVNLIEGREEEMEVFTLKRGRPADIWLPLRFVKENGVWVRKLTDHHGDPIPQGCMKCHGFGEDFGPTPKLGNFERPKGWFQIFNPRTGRFERPRAGLMAEGMTGENVGDSWDRPLKIKRKD
jgi:hypothetical protein